MLRDIDFDNNSQRKGRLPCDSFNFAGALSSAKNQTETGPRRACRTRKYNVGDRFRAARRKNVVVELNDARRDRSDGFLAPSQTSRRPNASFHDTLCFPRVRDGICLRSVAVRRTRRPAKEPPRSVQKRLRQTRTRRRVFFVIYYWRVFRVLVVRIKRHVGILRKMRASNNVEKNWYFPNLCVNSPFFVLTIKLRAGKNRRTVTRFYANLDASDNQVTTIKLAYEKEMKTVIKIITSVNFLRTQVFHETY